MHDVIDRTRSKRPIKMPDWGDVDTLKRQVEQADRELGRVERIGEAFDGDTHKARRDAATERVLDVVRELVKRPPISGDAGSVAFCDILLGRLQENLDIIDRPRYIFAAQMMQRKLLDKLEAQLTKLTNKLGNNK